LRLNDPANFSTSSYGQLYVNGIPAANLTGVVSKEYRAPRHGNGNYFQQIAIPFAGKAYGTLSTELGKAFSVNRFTQNEILSWNNTNAVSNHVTNMADTTPNAPLYYMLGSKNNNLDLSTPPATLTTIAPTVAGTVFTLTGKPVRSEDIAAVTLQNGGNVTFGNGGNAVNQYNEKYSSYLQDQFDLPNGYFTGTYGKNIYQFGNPYFTNLDLSKIGYNETASVTDGNNISNIWGVKYTAGSITTSTNGSTFSAGAQTQTYDPTTRLPVGDAGMIIQPMQTFVLKLRDNSSQTLNFSTLRRFSNTPRGTSTNYSVTAAKNGAGTVKQLGVIALDVNGKELGRTYYVVTPTATTGHQTSSATSIQAAATGGDAVGTFEESTSGGYDYSNTNYWLYINEANEVNFKGKNVKLVTYSPAAVKSYKFEIRENAELVSDGTHTLSSGIGFYYKAPNGTVQQAIQGAVIPVAGVEYDLYYGQPSNVVLATTETKAPVRTLVVYNPAIDNYIVRFDPNWKKADVEVYDMSGKLVISKKAVETSRDFVIDLDKAVKNSYMVKVVSGTGDVVNAKILK